MGCGIKHVVWEWFDEIWYEYLPIVGNEIEKARESGLQEFTFKWKEGMPTIYQGSDYVINLQTNTQTNNQTKYSRPIRNVTKLKDYRYVAWLTALWGSFVSLSTIANELLGKPQFPVPKKKEVRPTSPGLSGSSKVDEKNPAVLDRIIKIRGIVEKLCNVYFPPAQKK